MTAEGGYRRPDPDTLLVSIKKEEERQAQGRLKVFFGMAAGVGKTYAMLKAAGRRKHEGIDVAAGYVETHGRPETEELLAGIPLIPRAQTTYRGVTLEEMDTDAVLARRPAIVLVDELAHTNAPGSRHAKRYQDVTEILDRGIDVYTTLNVQHLESQADEVERITGAKVRETVPDSLLDMADEIELVDISPGELLQRLAEGKVYTPERAEVAVKRFFREENLAALREMSLRYTAQLVDYQLRDYMQRKRIVGPWKSGEHLLVAVSSSPYSEYLIRWTRRTAFNLKAPWTALYIERERERRLTESDRARLSKNLDLARELGAEVISTVDDDIVSGLTRVARQRNVTQIVVGKPLRRYLSDYFRGGTLVERLLEKSEDIEIHVVTRPDVGGGPGPPAWGDILSSTARQYLLSAVIVAAVTLLNLGLVTVTGYWTIGLLYLVSVLLVSLLVGGGPVILAASLSALSWNFLFIPPLYTFHIGRLEDALMFGMYFVIALVTGGLTSRLRSKEQALRARERRLEALYDFSRELANAGGVDQIADVVVRHVSEYLRGETALLLPDESGGLGEAPHPSSTLHVGRKELAVAAWSYANRKSAGLNTDTLSSAAAHYIPLLSQSGCAGVLGVRPPSGARFTLEQENYLQSIAYQSSAVLERERLAATGRKAMVLAESERLYKILLNSISHELRTPLTTITGASTSLQDETVDAVPDTRRALLQEIQRAGERLNRIVENLLDMSRLESGMLRLKRQLHDVGDLVSVSLRRLGSEMSGRSLGIDMADNLPLVYIDFSLMEQVLANLLHNAAVHTPPGTRIEIGARREGTAVLVSVRDTGPGLDEADMPNLFEKFRRGPGAGPGGSGLGLSISRGIVEAHGGSIRAANHPDGGAVFEICLPLQRPPGEVPING